MNAAGSFPRLVSLDAVAARAWGRLFKACACSSLLHVALLVGLPVVPSGSGPATVAPLTVRLEPAVAASAALPENPAPIEAPAEQARAAADPRKSPDSSKGARPVSRAPEPASPPVAGIEAPFARDPTYYPAKQLDVYPRPLSQIRLDYPASAITAKVDGRLMVLLLIDEFGTVNEATVVESRPEGFFEEAALEVLRAARFTAAEKQGRPVKSRVLLQVNYSYGNSAATLY